MTGIHLQRNTFEIQMTATDKEIVGVVRRKSGKAGGRITK